MHHSKNNINVNIQPLLLQLHGHICHDLRFNQFQINIYVDSQEYRYLSKSDEYLFLTEKTRIVSIDMTVSFRGN